MSHVSPRILRALRCAVLVAAIGAALTMASGSEVVVHSQAQYLPIGYVDCGGLDEAPCDITTGFGSSNGGSCDRGLKTDFIANKCINNTRRQKLNPESDVTVGKNFAQSWIGRALRIQRQDLNWATSYGRLSQIMAHNGFNNAADGYVFPNQKYSLTELLDAGIRAFEWDVHHDASLAKALPQLCHAEFDHLTCAITDRDLFNGLKELRDWMTEPGHENEVVMFGLEYNVDENPPGDNDLDGDFLVTNVIARFLDTPDIGVLTEPELEAYMTSHPTPEQYSLKREWPSQKWLVETGNRVIFTGPGPVRGPYFVNLSYGEAITGNPPVVEMSNRSGSRYPESQIDAWMTNATGYPNCSTTLERNGTSGNVKYLRPESGVFYTVQSDDDPVWGAATITPDLVAALTACNVDLINFDNVLVDWGRMQAAVWSWEINQPSADAAGMVARMARGNGRWWATSPLDQRPFLCRKETRRTIASGLVTNLPEVVWQVSNIPGTFVDGFDACAAIGDGWKFSPPLSGYENLNAKAVVENLAADPYINFISDGDDKWYEFTEWPALEIAAPVTVNEGETGTITVTLAPSWTMTEWSCGDGAELLETLSSMSATLQNWTLSCRYALGPERDVVASFAATHPRGSIERSAVVRVKNKAPEIRGVEDRSVVAGVPLYLDVELLDVAGESLGLRVDFDDHADFFRQPVAPGVHQFTHTYSTPGTYQLLVVAVDDASRTEEIATITVTSPAPTGSIEGPTRVSLNQSETFYIDAWDPDGGVVSYKTASCGNAGVLIGTTFISEAGPVRRYAVRCRFTAAAESNEIRITMIDDEEHETTFPWFVRIGRPPTGLILRPASMASINEGSTSLFTLLGTNTDGDDVKLVSLVSIGCGSGTKTSQSNDLDGGINLKVEFSCHFADSAASTQLTATISDFDGSTDVERSIVVANRAPALANIMVTSSLKFGDDARVSGTTSDPGGDAVKVRVNWGDDSDPAVVDAVNNQFIAWHRFQAAGAYDVIITPIDDENLEGSPETRSITIDDVVAATALTAVSAPAAGVVGGSLTAQATLSRGDNVAVGAGHDITFTITAPDGTTTTPHGTTDNSGLASVDFAPQLRGQHTVAASFAGSDALLTSSAPAATVTVYQRTSLSLQTTTPSVTAGVGLTLRATLAGVPDGTPLDGQSVEFSFTGTGAPAPQVVTTDGGEASVTVVFPAAGTFTAHATFLNAGGFFADHTGVSPVVAETAMSSITVTAATSTTTVISPTSALTAVATPLSATLSRNDGIEVGAGREVMFTVTAPDGTSSDVSGITNADGVASAAFTPAIRGRHSVTASFTGNAALAGSSSFSASFDAYERTSIAVTGAAGSAGQPIAVTALLTAVPNGAVLPGQTVVFSFSGPGAPAPLSAATNASGIATATPVFPAAGTFTVQASFLNALAFFTDGTGAVPAIAETADASIEATNAAPTFTPPAAMTIEATNSAGGEATFNPTGTDPEDGELNAQCLPASGSTFAIGTTTVACTVTDRIGAFASGSFTVTVRDTTAPAIAAHGNVTADATGAAGAVVTYTRPAYTDLVSGSGLASCAPASGSTFAIGTTTVTCTATDAAGNTGRATFSVTVENTTTPGRMHGDGFIKKGDTRYEFNFKVVERASGSERGHFELDVQTDKPRGKNKGHDNDRDKGRDKDRDDDRDKGRDNDRDNDRNDDRDRFVARDITFIAFSDDPTYRPGRKRKPQVDTVRFSGTGSWNGAKGYRFEVTAADEGEPGRHRESVTITVWSPSGAIAAQVAGELSGGNVQSLRIHR